MDAKRYTTHKNTRAAKMATQARKQLRTIKRTPATEKSLQQIAASVNARYVV